MHVEVGFGVRRSDSISSRQRQLFTSYGTIACAVRENDARLCS